jgi:hypothetical protein
MGVKSVQLTGFDDNVEVNEITAADESAMAGIDRLADQHTGKTDRLRGLGQLGAHSSQPGSRKTAPLIRDPSLFDPSGAHHLTQLPPANPSVAPTAASSRASRYGAIDGQSSAFVDLQAGNRVHRPPPPTHTHVGHLLAGW